MSSRKFHKSPPINTFYRAIVLSLFHRCKRSCKTCRPWIYRLASRNNLSFTDRSRLSVRVIGPNWTSIYVRSSAPRCLFRDSDPPPSRPVGLLAMVNYYAFNDTMTQLDDDVPAEFRRLEIETYAMHAVYAFGLTQPFRSRSDATHLAIPSNVHEEKARYIYL